MPKQYKIDSVADFRDRLANSEIAIATRYVGISVEKVTMLRKRLRDAGVEYKVFKNTYSRIALRDAGLESAADLMEGPTAWAFCSDPTVPAKMFKDLAKEIKFVGMVGGVLNGKVVSGEQLQALADLPSRDVLLSQLVGVIAAPLQNLLGALQGVPRNMVNVVDQIRKQKEGGEAA